MRYYKRTCILLFFFSLCGLLVPLNSLGQQRNKLDIAFNSGFQSENFGWSIAGNLNGQNPNIYSELKWNRLGEIASSANLTWRITSRLYVRGGYNYNSIITGKASDTDYGSDHRSTPIYHGDFAAQKGYTDNATAGLGFFAVSTRKINLAIETGFTFIRQSLYLTGLNGQNPDLNTGYFTNWKGIFVSGDFTYKIGQRISFKERITYSQLNYSARADWNLIQQFAHPISYRDNAAGFNLQTLSAIIYQFNKRYSIDLSPVYSHAKTGNGVDKLYLINAAQEETQFNGASRDCYQLTAGISMTL